MPSSRCLKCLDLNNRHKHYGLHPKCFKAWFEVDELFEFKSLILKQSSKSGDFSVGSDDSSFFHGQYKKYEAKLEGRSYILKVRQSSAPELPELEFLCNQIAESLGVPVAPHFLIELMGDRTFATRNFIDHSEHATLAHIHTYFEEDQPRNCETIIQIIDQQTHRFSDVETFVNTCLFDSLIGNHDRHGRNLGFIVTPRGSKLAPIYDNPSVVGIHTGNWLKADIGYAGRIPTHDSKHPTISNYAREFIRLGYPEQVERFKKVATLENISSIVKNSFCSDLMKSALIRMIGKHIDELTNT